jgi:hypothetical protein
MNKWPIHYSTLRRYGNVCARDLLPVALVKRACGWYNLYTYSGGKRRIPRHELCDQEATQEYEQA